jgi:probable phosphoglycerate mutase
MANRFFVLRHGQSEANAQGIILSDPARGVDGFGLTELGREQVRSAVADHPVLGEETVIYSSDFARARETAELAREVLGAGAVTTSQALRERGFGSWEGTSNANYERVWELDRENPGHTEAGVESVMSVLGRTSAFVAELVARHQGAVILLVGHGDPLQILETGFRTMNPADHRSLPPLPPAGLRELARAGG